MWEELGEGGGNAGWRVGWGSGRGQKGLLGLAEDFVFSLQRAMGSPGMVLKGVFGRVTKSLSTSSSHSFIRLSSQSFRRG